MNIFQTRKFPRLENITRAGNGYLTVWFDTVIEKLLSCQDRTELIDTIGEINPELNLDRYQSLTNIELIKKFVDQILPNLLVDEHWDIVGLNQDPVFSFDIISEEISNLLDPVNHQVISFSYIDRLVQIDHDLKFLLDRYSDQESKKFGFTKPEILSIFIKLFDLTKGRVTFQEVFNLIKQFEPKYAKALSDVRIEINQHLIDPLSRIVVSYYGLL